MVKSKAPSVLTLGLQYQEIITEQVMISEWNIVLVLVSRWRWLTLRFPVTVLRCAVAAFWLEVFPVADDWTFFACFASGLADVLDDESVVSVLVFAVAVLHEGEAEVFPVFALVECGIVDLGGIDV